MNNSTETLIEDNFTAHRVKFSIMLVLEVGAIIISLVIFVFFMKHPKVLSAPRYHVLSILLLTNFLQLVIDIPLPMRFYISGYVNPASSTFCSWWTFIEFTFAAINEYLVATMSVQRHILIFNRHLMRGRWKHMMLCNLPIMFCLIYPATFYLFAILLYNCNGIDPWDYTSNVCGSSGCYLNDNIILTTYDWVVHNCLPMVIDVLANAILITRVISKRQNLRRGVSWRQQQTMVKQLFGISLIYIVGWGPVLTVILVQTCCDPNFLVYVDINYFLDFTYIPCFLLPWICVGLIPELTKWIKLAYDRRRSRNVVEAITMTNHGTTVHHIAPRTKI